MSWMKPVASEEVAERDERHLRIDSPEKVHETTEIKVRILDENPKRVYRHWIGNRPLNCPDFNTEAGRWVQGARTCPACAIRNKQKRDGNEQYRDLFRLENRYLTNILTGGEVKIWWFGQKLYEKVIFYANREGDPRDYDLTIIKRRTGPGKLNLEYDLLKDGPKVALTAEQMAIADGRHDLDAEIIPASPQDIADAIAGESLSDTPMATGLGLANKATPAQILKLTELAQKRSFTLEQLGIDPATVSTQSAAEYITDLSR